MEMFYVKLLNKTFGVIINGDKVGVCVNGFGKVYYMPVIEDSSVAFALKKTRIKARGGAAGLVEFICRCEAEQFMECNAIKICEHIIKNGGSAK